MTKSNLAAHKLLCGAIRWSVVNLLGTATSKKTDSPYLQSYHSLTLLFHNITLSVVPWLGVGSWGLMNPSLFHAKMLTGLILCKPSADSTVTMDL